MYTKEPSDVLSGCEACGKSQKDVEMKLEGMEERSREERMERLRKRGLPLIIGSKNE